MEVRTYVRKIAALATGLTMVGATIFGASAAADLAMYPAPFLKDGEPNKLAIVVGDGAASSDVIGSIDITQGLQALAVKKVPVASGGAKKTVLKGDAHAIGTGSDLLEINETVGDVQEVLTSSDLAALAGGSITTDEGTTQYNQYLEFNSSVNYTSLKVFMAEDEYDNVADFLFVNDGDQLFNWKLEFERGLKSEIDGNDVKDLEDESINIMGKVYTIVDTDIGPANRLQLDLLTGPVSDTLGEGESKTYEIGGKEYKVEVLVISETANDGDGEVLIRVNGETLDKLSDGETDVMSDGTLFGVRDIVATGKDTQKSVVRFFVGAKKIELTDTDYTDDSYNSGGAEIDNEDIEDGAVRIKASNDTRRITVSSVEYKLDVDAIKGDLYVPVGHGVREYLDEPQGMLTADWDIWYAGLTDVPTTTFKLDSQGDDSYQIDFVNQEGLHYKFDYLTNEGGTFKFGDEDDDLWFFEIYNASIDLRGSPGTFNGAGNTTNISTAVTSCDGVGNAFFARHYISIDDSFILSDGASVATADNTAFTHVMTWDNIDISNRKLTFSDEAGGSKEIIYDATTRRGDLIVGGSTYSVFVNNTNGTIYVDLNGDGSSPLGVDRAFLTTKGGMLVDLNANFSCVSAGNNISTLRTAGLGTAGSFKMNMTTLSKEFDEPTTNEVVTVNVVTRSGNELGVGSVSGITLNELKDNEDIERGLSLFGSLYELFDPSSSDQAEELTIQYPESQRGAQVYVKFGGTESETIDTLSATQVVPIQIGAAKLASEVADITAWNAIVVGGPCANSVAAALLNNPADCTQGFVEGEAWLKMWEHSNGNVALLVAGFSALDTRRAARVIANHKDYAGALKGMEVKVKGTTLTDIRIEAVA